MRIDRREKNPYPYNIMSDQSEAVVRHVAMIMDGNRRWAHEQGLSSVEGHREGYENMKRIGDWCLERGVLSLSVFAFSTENWKRSETEVNFLMAILEQALGKELNYFIERKVRLRVLGRKEGFSKKIQKLIDDAEEATKDFDRMTFGICLNYGGRFELVDAVKSLMAAGVSADSIDESTIAKHLYWPDMPDPDLVIRTSGERRLSGFLTWQTVYSELYFTDVYWPAFDEKGLDKAFEVFKTRQRRFGK